jgi:hypothetical protein
MTKYREIIRLTGLGFSQRNTMASCGVAQKTVVKVQKRARELNLSWPLDESITDTKLQKFMFSKGTHANSSRIRISALDIFCSGDKLPLSHSIHFYIIFHICRHP